MEMAMSYYGANQSSPTSNEGKIMHNTAWLPTGSFRMCSNNDHVSFIAFHTVQDGSKKILVAICVRLYDISLTHYQIVK